MSIDRAYTQIEAKWVQTNPRVVDGDWEFIPDDEFQTDFWVDICHVVGVDERYYFPDLASALDFYLEGWTDRQYLDEDGEEQGIDHSGLYSRGHLINGQSISTDSPSMAIGQATRARTSAELVRR